MRMALMVVLALGAATVPAGAVVRYVDGSAPAGGDGRSWQAAFFRLQDALAAAQSGDEVRVAGGVYKPGAPGSGRNVSFVLRDGVTMRGGYAGRGSGTPDARDPSVFVTTLSGDLNGDDVPNGGGRSDNCFHVVSATMLSSGVIVDGFRVVGGNADGVANPSGFSDRGGGVFAQINPALSGGAVLRLVGCVLEDNDGKLGGGASTYAVDCRAERTVFRGNRAQSGGGFGDTSNSATQQRHAFIGCLFEGNLATGLGGSAIMCMPNTYELWVVGVRFTRNTALGGGAIYTTGSFQAHGRAINCVFDRNRASDGAAWFDDFTTTNRIVNCTIVDNSSTGSGGAAIVSIGLDMRIANSILRDPETSVEISGGSLVSVRSSDVRGGHAGAGNIDADAGFRNAATGDYRLRRGSPCVDSGVNAEMLPDQFDLNGNGNTVEPTPFDMSGAARFVDDPASPPNGVVTVDMGAFERRVCPGDADDDLVVTFADLNIVLGQFGRTGAVGALAGDLDGDGVVGFADLNIVLGAFGNPC